MISIERSNFKDKFFNWFLDPEDPSIRFRNTAFSHLVYLHQLLPSFCWSSLGNAYLEILVSNQAESIVYGSYQIHLFFYPTVTEVLVRMLLTGNILLTLIISGPFE